MVFSLKILIYYYLVIGEPGLDNMMLYKVRQYRHQNQHYHMTDGVMVMPDGHGGSYYFAN